MLQAGWPQRLNFFGEPVQKFFVQRYVIIPLAAFLDLVVITIWNRAIWPGSLDSLTSTLCVSESVASRSLDVDSMLPNFWIIVAFLWQLDIEFTGTAVG